MNAAVPLSDDELWAPGEALCYVKEALADMALSSIRRRTDVMLYSAEGGAFCLCATDRFGQIQILFLSCLDNACSPL